MSSNSRRFNLLFIMSDNHPAELLGCYGNPEIHTPHLDQLARQGIQFQNAYCPNSMCSPGRASVLTGLMPSQHGIHTWLDDRLMDQWPERWNAIAGSRALPQLLADHGYRTALIGKYHLGAPFHPQNGFQHWVTFPYGHTRDFWNNQIIENDKRYVYPGHAVDCLTEKAVEFVQAYETRGDSPFFLFLTYNAPYGHRPAIQGRARNRFASLYENCPMSSIPREGISRQAVARYDFKKDQSGGGIDYSDDLTTANDLGALRNYFSQMSLVDDGVGRVLAALRRQGLDEDTLVIYTCDHGLSLGHHGFWGHGQATWPSNTHRAAFSIPLLLRHPGRIKPGSTSEYLVSSVDLFATILEYAGLEPSAGNANSPSRSLVSQLYGDEIDWEDAVYMEQEETRSIRTGEWLYMRRFPGSQRYPLQDELYHLATDPDEKRNRIGEPGLSGVAAELAGRIDAYFSQYARADYDLWKGGRAKSNSDKPWLWRDAWGEQWRPVYKSETV